jgi:hypothetical protein
MTASAGASITRHLAPFQLEAVRLGLVSAAEQASARDHLGGCGRCADLAAALAVEHRVFADEIGPRMRAQLAFGIQRQRRHRLVAWLSVGIAVPALAGLMLLARPRTAITTAAQDEGPDLAVKGGGGFLIAARRGQRVFRPSPHDPVRAGDQIRFVVRAPPLPFVLIASVDGAGRPNLYVPYEGASSVPVGGAAPDAALATSFELPGSIVLDATPGPERVFAIFSAAPLPAGPIRVALGALGARGPDAIRSTARLDLGTYAAAAEQSSILLERAQP